jgi:hypothetical protein
VKFWEGKKKEKPRDHIKYESLIRESLHSNLDCKIVVPHVDQAWSRITLWGKVPWVSSVSQGISSLELGLKLS